MSRYVFTDQSETERLRLQAQVWQPAAAALLDAIDIQPGATCLDMGCGSRGILALLAQRVGPSGRVVGIELDDAHGRAARQHIADAGLDNVELIQGDIYDTGLERASFDLVHGRFLFAPLGRADDLLREMIALTRPGGVIATQEPDQSSWDYLPPRPIWPRVKQLFEDVFPRFGGNANAGKTTYGLLRAAGLEEVRVRAAALALQDCHPYMQTPIVGLQAMRPFILEYGLMTEAELDNAIVELHEICADPDVYAVMFSLTQVWGRKPHSPGVPG